MVVAAARRLVPEYVPCSSRPNAHSRRNGAPLVYASVWRSGAHLGDAPRRLLSEVSRECDRLTTVIEELMALVEQVVAGLRTGSDGQRVDVQIDPLPNIHGDPVLLRQV